VFAKERNCKILQGVGPRFNLGGDCAQTGVSQCLENMVVDETEFDGVRAAHCCGQDGDAYFIRFNESVLPLLHIEAKSAYLATVKYSRHTATETSAPVVDPQQGLARLREQEID
jgi:hypothetical protein